MYEIVLIDIDNTLFDFDKAERKAIEETLRILKIVPTEIIIDKFKKINSHLWKEFEKGRISKEELLEKRFKEFLAVCGKNTDAKLVNAYYLNRLSNSSDLMPYAQETLEVISKKVKIYPVTNGVYNTQMRRINASTVKDYFSKIYISESIGIPKPEAGFFDYVFADLGNPDKSKVLLVGDSLSADIVGGINYGLDTCWYNPQKLVSYVPYRYQIQDLRELIDIIK